MPLSVTDFVVDAAFRRSNGNGKIYIYRGGRYFRSSATSSEFEVENGYPELISGAGFAGAPHDLNAAVVASKDSKIHFFKGSLHYYYDDGKIRVGNGYPKQISEEWPGLPDCLDAALQFNESTYFFKGDEYWLWDDVEDQVADGYPKPIYKDWPGIPNNVDAALTDSDGNAYFFVGKQYYKYDALNYPKPACDGWAGLCA